MKLFPFIVLLPFVAATSKKLMKELAPFCTKKMDCYNNLRNSICATQCLLVKDCVNYHSWMPDPIHRAWFRDIHNEYRQRVASGSDTRGGNRASSNMMVLNYDMALEIPALCWTKKCAFKHDFCRRVPKYPLGTGQNLWLLKTNGRLDATKKSHVEMALESWYEEMQFTNAKRLQKLSIVGVPGNQKIGHYFSLIAAKTSNIGCARSSFEVIQRGRLINVFYLACHYGPEASYAGHKVYEFGAPASKCPAGTKANSKYPALCGELHPIPQDNVTVFPINTGNSITLMRWTNFLIILLPFVVMQALS